jgi:hypothetical protein
MVAALFYLLFISSCKIINYIQFYRSVKLYTIGLKKGIQGCGVFFFVVSLVTGKGGIMKEGLVLDAELFLRMNEFRFHVDKLEFLKAKTVAEEMIELILNQSALDSKQRRRMKKVMKRLRELRNQFSVYAWMDRQHTIH